MLKYILAAGAGVAVGYLIAQHRYEQEFHVRLEEELSEAREFFHEKYEKKLDQIEDDKRIERLAREHISKVTLVRQERHAADILSTKGSDEEIAEVVKPLIRDYQGISAGPSVTDQELRAAAIQEIPESVSDDPQVIISFEEFARNDDDYKQFSLTYFVGDDILAGESDQIIDVDLRNTDIGPEIMAGLMYGRIVADGSDVIYIRNPVKHMEFEIARSRGKYSVEVLGNNTE